MSEPRTRTKYVYDAENRLLNYSTSGSYTYDGNSLRVKKVSGSTTTVYIFSGSKVIAEYDNSTAVGSPSREYIYSGGALLAKIDSTGTKYYHQDHLSNRVVTDSSGNTAAQLGHFPFGESWYNDTNDKLLFTSYARDAESGNDYAMMRYGVNRLGRFTSSDPLSGSRGNPQSLNHYAYVHNDPVNSVDPTGLQGSGLYYYCGGDNVSASYCSGIGDSGGGGGMSCSYQPGQPCVTMGLEIFDAIAGVPGTYLTQDMYGNVGFGFSINLWQTTWNFIDQARVKLGNSYNPTPSMSGYTVFAENSGVFTTVSGFIPDLLAATQTAQENAGSPPHAPESFGEAMRVLAELQAPDPNSPGSPPPSLAAALGALFLLYPEVEDYLMSLGDWWYNSTAPIQDVFSKYPNIIH